MTVILPSQPSDFIPEYKKTLDKSIAQLEANKLEAQAINNPKAFVRTMVTNNGPLWWTHWREDMESEDPSIRRNAMIEYNKLQARMLPTELTGADGATAIINIMNYATEASKQIDDVDQSFIDVESSAA